MMRDAPINELPPERFEPANYHARKMAEIRTEIARLKDLTEEEATAERDAEYAEDMAYRVEREEEIKERSARYRSMLDAVNAWTPPTLPAAKWWRSKKMAKAAADLEYHEKAHAEEIERTNGRNAWLKALRKSL